MSLAIPLPLLVCDDSASCTGSSNSSAIVCECHSSSRRTLSLHSAPGTRTHTAAEARDKGERGAGERAMSERERDACVLYHEKGGIATLTLNRPKVKGLATTIDRYPLPAQVEPGARTCSLLYPLPGMHEL